jgi:hypothetical protein
MLRMILDRVSNTNIQHVLIKVALVAIEDKQPTRHVCVCVSFRLFTVSV